jgi:hypothetical protein
LSGAVALGLLRSLKTKIQVFLYNVHHQLVPFIQAEAARAAYAAFRSAVPRATGRRVRGWSRPDRRVGAKAPPRNRGRHHRRRERRVLARGRRGSAR